MARGVPTGMYGPRTQAQVALCTGAYRLSKRTTQQVLADLFGLPMSLGTLSHSEEATTEAVAAPVEEARTYVQRRRAPIWTRRAGAKAGNVPGCGWPLPCG